MTQNITVHTFDTYSPEIAAGIGSLMPQLDPSFSDRPMSEAYFSRHFQGTERAILIAMQAGKVVGTAVMNTLIEQAPEAESGYMGGFVVDQEARGGGAAAQLWREMKAWCCQRGLSGFGFNTEIYRTRAIEFYKKMGAKLVDGTDTHYFVAIEKDLKHLGVRDNFSIDSNAVIARNNSGIVNETYVVEQEGEKSIIQRLNPAFGTNLLEDGEVVSRHLSDSGWESPTTIRTASGKLFYEDEEGILWRKLSYIESDGDIPESLVRETAWQVGNMLGRWHQTMARLDYEPTFTIPHFHETDYHADKLRRYLPSFPDSKSREMAELLLSTYDKNPELPEGPIQLLHGDPQLTNILFRDGQPFTYIDLDTIMRGSIWLDIGDLLRATLEHDLKAERSMNIDTLHTIVEGYRSVSAPEVDPKTFFEHAAKATQLIALELAMRFMNDIVDDNYFLWDSDEFKSRRDNHMMRTNMQWQIYQALKDAA